MLRGNYTTISITIIISIITKTFIFINFMKIITCIDAAAAQNQTTQLIITNNNDLISSNNTNNNISDEDDNELISYVTILFCQLNSNPVYIYIDHEMLLNRIVQNMIISIHTCMRSTIYVKSVNATESFIHQQLNTNNSLNFTMFLIIDQLSDRPDKQFSFISKFIRNKNRKKFILFINNTNNTQNSFRQLFREFHEKLIYNIIVVARSETTNYDVMTYNPFASVNYVEYFGRNETRLSKLFYNKIFRNAHKRIRMKIILFEEQSRMIIDYAHKVITGVDGFMLATIMNNMNAEYEIRRPRDNKTYGAFQNNSMYGTLKDIVEWRGDISFNSRFLKPNEYLHIVEPTVVLGRDDLCLMVPNSGNQSHIGNLLLSFSYIIWILIILMIFCVSTTMYFTQKFLCKTRRWKRHEVRYVVLTVFKSNLNQSLRKTPTVLQIRIILIAWLFYSFLITNSFIANLTSVLILERESQQIDSLDELAQSGLEILSVLRYKNELIRNLNMTKASHVQIARRLKLVEETDLHSLINNNTVTYGYVEKDHVIKHILDLRSHLISGRRMFHEMAQCPVPNLITYITPIGSPYLDRINFLVRQILESGLYSWWRKNLEIERRSNRNRRFIKSTNNSSPFKNLALSHLQLVFYLLGFGLSLATIVFAVEMGIIGNKWRKWKYKIVKILSKYVKKIIGRNR